MASEEPIQIAVIGNTRLCASATSSKITFCFLPCWSVGVAKHCFHSIRWLCFRSIHFLNRNLTCMCGRGWQDKLNHTFHGWRFQNSRSNDRVCSDEYHMRRIKTRKIMHSRIQDKLARACLCLYIYIYIYIFAIFRPQVFEGNMTFNNLEYNIWDTAGHERFRSVVTGLVALSTPTCIPRGLDTLDGRWFSLLPSHSFFSVSEFVKKAAGIVICYDITNRDSFESAFDWTGGSGGAGDYQFILCVHILFILCVKNMRIACHTVSPTKREEKKTRIALHGILYPKNRIACLIV